MKDDKNKMVISTRKSELALTQARFIASALKQNGVDTDISPRSTIGDDDQKMSVTEMGGKGVFVRGVQHDLLDIKADIAVHSYKDMPLASPDGLKIAALPRRHAAADVIVWRDRQPDLEEKILGPVEVSWANSVDRVYARYLENLDKGIAGFFLPKISNLRIGTSSLRRKGLLHMACPNIEIVPIRGNIQTRIEKMASMNLDGIVIAEASLDRLNLKEKVLWSRLNPAYFIPSPAQGILAVETRSNENRAVEALASIHDAETEKVSRIERGVMAALGGDCSTPIGVYSRIEHQVRRTRAVVFDGRGKEARAEIESPIDESVDVVVRQVVEALVAKGLIEILDTLSEIGKKEGKNIALKSALEDYYEKN